MESGGAPDLTTLPDLPTKAPRPLFELCVATLLQSLSTRPVPTKNTLRIALIGILNTGKSLYVDLMSSLFPVPPVKSFELTPLNVWASVTRFTLATDRGPLDISAIDVPGHLYHQALESLGSCAEPEIDCVLLIHSAAVAQTLFPALRAAEILSMKPRNFAVGLVGITVPEKELVRPQASGPQGDTAEPPSLERPTGPGVDFSTLVALRTVPTVELFEPLLAAYSFADPPKVLEDFSRLIGWQDALRYLGYNYPRELQRELALGVSQEEMRKGQERELTRSGTGSSTASSSSTLSSPRWTGFPGTPKIPVAAEVEAIDDPSPKKPGTKFGKPCENPDPVYETAGASSSSSVTREPGWWGSVLARIAGLGAVLSK